MDSLTLKSKGAGKVVDPLDVIVRFHNPERLFELRRAVFSLVCQNFSPTSITLATQRFSPAQIAEVTSALAPTLAIDTRIGFRVENYSAPSPADARSALLNMGMKALNGRYLAFLDHDDTILPDGYRDLIGELESSGCAIAFGSVAMKDVDVFADALLVEHRREVFQGKNLVDLVRRNFCPIHSFVLDRMRVAVEDLWFDETMSRGEDYDFLLRICAKYPSSFALIGRFVGDYYVKNDGTNTPESELLLAEQEIEKRKRTYFQNSQHLLPQAP